jgi:hypothetical protein
MTTQQLTPKPAPHRRIRHKARLVLPEYPVAVAGDEIVDGISQRLRQTEQHARPASAWKMRQHGQRRKRVATKRDLID